MAIPIGKLALYTAACGIHPSLTLPVSLDVGTDNPWLLADPLYLGLPGAAAARRRVRRARRGVRGRRRGGLAGLPDPVRGLQAAQRAAPHRALPGPRARRSTTTSQGTAAVVVAGVLAGLRATGRTLADARIVLVGAGAAGIGIGRLLRLAMLEAGVPEDVVREAIALVDTKGLVHAGRADLEPSKAELAVPAVDGRRRPTSSRRSGRGGRRSSSGTTGVAGTFSESVIREMDERVAPGRPADRAAAVQPDIRGRGHPGRRPRLDRRARAGRDRLAVRRGGGRRPVRRRSARPTTRSSSRASASARSSPSRGP